MQEPTLSTAQIIAQHGKRKCFGSGSGDEEASKLEAYVARLNEGGDFARIEYGTHEDTARVTNTLKSHVPSPRMNPDSRVRYGFTTQSSITNWE